MTQRSPCGRRTRCRAVATPRGMNDTTSGQIRRNWRALLACLPRKAVRLERNDPMGQGIRDGLHNVGAFLPKLGAFILIILATWIVAAIVKSLVTKLLRRLGVDNLV